MLKKKFLTSSSLVGAFCLAISLNMSRVNASDLLSEINVEEIITFTQREVMKALHDAVMPILQLVHDLSIENGTPGKHNSRYDADRCWGCQDDSPTKSGEIIKTINDSLEPLIHVARATQTNHKTIFKTWDLPGLKTMGLNPEEISSDCASILTEAIRIEEHNHLDQVTRLARVTKTREEINAALLFVNTVSDRDMREQFRKLFMRELRESAPNHLAKFAEQINRAPLSDLSREIGNVQSFIGIFPKQDQETLTRIFNEARLTHASDTTQQKPSTLSETSSFLVQMDAQ